VAAALQLSELGQNYLKRELEELLVGYFTFEFKRRERLLEKLSLTEE